MSAWDVIMVPLKEIPGMEVQFHLPDMTSEHADQERQR
jgi:hypothetical protein